MLIRCLSDLHLDVNHNFPLKLRNNKDFTILAGDTSGDYTETISWVKTNVKKGILIAGNHLVYNRSGKTIHELKEELHKAFPVDSDVTFLDVDVGVCSKVVDGVLFLGSTMYTNYEYDSDDIYYPRRPEIESMAEYNMRLATNPRRCMNDWAWGILEKTNKDGITDYKHISPSYYLEQFEKTYSEFNRILDENEKSGKPLPVVIVTHHPISSKAISETFSKDSLNASYISDLEDCFILKHSSIRAIVSGHVHHQGVFDIERTDGNMVRYVLNPRGYEIRGESLGKNGFNEDTYIDTKNWNVKIKPKSKSRIAKEDKRLKDLLAQTYMFGF